MAGKYWVGPTNGSWFDDANWSLTSGGAGGAGVPTSSDIAQFNVASTNKCLIDQPTPIVVSQLVKTACPIEITADADGGSITTASSFTIAGNGDFIVNSGVTNYTLTAGGTYLEANVGDVLLGAAVLNIYGNATFGANFDHTPNNSSSGAIYLYGEGNTLTFADGVTLHILSVEGTYTCNSAVAPNWSNAGTNENKCRLQVNGDFTWNTGLEGTFLLALHIFGSFTTDFETIVTLELRKYGNFSSTGSVLMWGNDSIGAHLYPGDYTDFESLLIGPYSAESTFTLEEGGDYYFDKFLLYVSAQNFNIDLNKANIHCKRFRANTISGEDFNINFNNSKIYLAAESGDDNTNSWIIGNITFENTSTGEIIFSNEQSLIEDNQQILAIQVTDGSNVLPKITLNNALALISSSSSESPRDANVNLTVSGINTIDENSSLKFEKNNNITISGNIDVDGSIAFEDEVEEVTVNGDFKVGSVSNIEAFNTSGLVLNVTGTALVKYSKVQNVDSSDGSKIYTQYCTDLGSNLNWDFNQNLILDNPSSPTINYTYIAKKGGLVPFEKGIALKISATGYAPTSTFEIYGRSSTEDFSLLKSTTVGTTTDFVYTWKCLTQGKKYFWYVVITTPTETITSDIETFTVQKEQSKQILNIGCSGITHKVKVNSQLVSPNFSAASTGKAMVPANTLRNLNR